MRVELVELQGRPFEEGRGERVAAASRMYRSVLHFGVLLALAAFAGAQSEFPFAAGTDSTGWAQAESNAEGRVMIESPEFPRGLWVELVDETGNGLAGLQVEYQGRPDGLVALRCVDPSGMRQETLLWSRPRGDLMQLRLKPSEPVDLPDGLVAIDLRIDPAAEALLKSEEVPRLSGWEVLAPYLQERWTGRVAVQIDGNTVIAVDLAHPELEALLVDFPHELAKESLGEIRASAVQGAFLIEQAFTSDFAFLEGVILLSTSFILAEGSELEKVVLRALGRSEGPVTLAEADALTSLRVHDMVDVSPLAALTNLESLGLYDNEIVDVKPLSALTNLKQLTLSSNEIVDVSPLSALTNLNELDLSFNGIVDVSPLSALTSMKQLDLGFNEIVDVSPLSVLTNLQWLRLYYNEIVDVSPLSALTTLRRLELLNNQIVDVSPLSVLTNLKRLALGSNEIADVGPLSALTNLNQVTLSSNEIVDVSALASWTRLTLLDLSFNQIADINSLSHLARLERLWLKSNRIVDVGALVANTGLGEEDIVDLTGNSLSDQALNEQIPALRERGVRVTF